MKTVQAKLYLLILSVFLAAASCGGEGTFAGGGIGGTGVTSSGEITSIGSIWVNGTRFDTGEAELFIDGQLQGKGDQAISDQLDVGRIVRVIGRLQEDGNSRADNVIYTPSLLGRVEAVHIVDDYTTELLILGQNTLVDARTRFKELSRDTLAVGDFVEVSGFLDDMGRLQATFITRAAPAQNVLRLTGPVGDLDLDAGTFFIHTQKIDYNQVDPSAIPPTVIQEGLLVSVSGRLDAAGIVLNAETLEKHARLGDVTTPKIELEGLIDTGLAKTGIDRYEFTMEGYRVEITPATLFMGGSLDDLLPGVRVEVKGESAAGVLVASTIKTRQIFRVESILAAKQSEPRNLSLVGLDGLTITVNELTRFQGQAAGFEQLSVGDHLVIKGWPAVDGKVMATQIIGLPSSPKTMLQAIVSAVDAPLITIGGVVVDTDAIPAEGFFLDDHKPVSRETFFSMVMEGDWAAVRGELSGNEMLIWIAIALGRQD